ncbi:hypothetical protein MBLNU457_5160t1 [Dothideomycetes sp. NU457]
MDVSASRKSQDVSLPPWAGGVQGLYNKRSRRPRVIRLLAIISIVGFIYLITIQSTFSVLARKDDSVAVQKIMSSGDYAQQRRAKKQQSPVLGYKGETVEADIAHPLRVKPTNKDTETLRFETSLRAVLDNTPTETQLEQLLSPIQESGKQRLHDTATRARALKSMLEPWEDLHLVHEQDKTHVRDDILRYLQQADNLSSISTTESRAELIRSYENYRSAVAKLSTLLFPWTAPYFADHMTLHAHIRHGGRGIVMSAGSLQIQHLLTSIKSIRQLGCNLPIEIMYLGAADLADVARTELENLPGVVTRNMKTMINDKGWALRGWSGKSHAILLSSFREVLYVDADALWLQNPAILFDETAYLNTGALFFYDQNTAPKSQSRRQWLQEVLPKPISTHVTSSRLWTGESGRMQDSGVMVIDKWQHFMAILFVTRMNGPDRDGNREKGIVGTYDMINSDKETFWVGFEAVGDTEYAFYEGEAANMGVARIDRGESPKIAATYERIAKHAEHGSKTGHEEGSVLSSQAELHKGSAHGAGAVVTSTQDMVKSSENKHTSQEEVEDFTGSAKPAADPPSFADDDEVRPNTLPPPGVKLDELVPADRLTASDAPPTSETVDDDYDAETNESSDPGYASTLTATETLEQDGLVIPTHAATFSDDDAVRPNMLPPPGFKIDAASAIALGAGMADAEQDEDNEEDNGLSIYDSVHLGDLDGPSADEPTSASGDYTNTATHGTLKKRTTILPAERQFQRARTTTEKKASAWIHADQPDTQSEESFSYSKPIAKGQPMDSSISSGVSEQNYTICSQQVLHLDTKGRPLWFSGWIVDKSENADVEVPDFQVFIKEKRGDGSVGPWSRREDGLNCLKSDRILRFTKQEKAVLERIMETAGEVGALGEDWSKYRRRRR